MKLAFRKPSEAGLALAYQAGLVRSVAGELPLLRMAIAPEVRRVGDEKSRVLRFIASTEVEDRDGDIIRVDGWELENFLKNPVHLWAHNMRQDNPPIGKTVRVEVSNGKLINDVDFFMADDFPLAMLAFKAHLAGVNAESVGFRPLEAAERRGIDGRFIGFEFKRQELLEISSVPVPSNPEALQLATQKGLLKPEEAEQIEKLLGPDTGRTVTIYLTGEDKAHIEPPASTPEEREVLDAVAAAPTLTEPERKVKQLHHLKLAQAYGLKVAVEIVDGHEAEGLQLTEILGAMAATSELVVKRNQAIASGVGEAVRQAASA